MISKEETYRVSNYNIWLLYCFWKEKIWYFSANQNNLNSYSRTEQNSPKILQNFVSKKIIEIWNVNGSQTLGKDNILPYPHTAHEQNILIEKF